MTDYPEVPPPASPTGETSTLAVISLISGVLAWFFFRLWVLSLPLSPDIWPKVRSVKTRYI
jgi:hypothetical protein